MARPPIRDFDQPLDDSGSDEVLARIAAEKEKQADKAEFPAIAKALWFKGHGFDILPVKTDQKAPSSDRWDSAIKNDPNVFLRNPGTRNYGLLPPPGHVILDVDKDAPDLIASLSEALGAWPQTLLMMTPNGRHFVFRWPDDLPKPKGAWWGKVVARWPYLEQGAGKGYVVGPGSVVNGKEYRLDPFADWPAAELPKAWAESALAWREPKNVAPTELFEQTGYVMPEVVEEGSRYEAVRTYSAHLYNRGLTKDERWAQVRLILAPRFRVPKTEAELRGDFDRSNSEIEERLGEPRALPDHGREKGEAVSPADLIERGDALLEALLNAAPPAWAIERFAVMGGLNVMGGHPKSGKSLATLQMGAAFAGRATFMERMAWSAGQGVFVYVTNEGARHEMAGRLARLESNFPGVLGSGRFRVVYLKSVLFDRSGAASMRGALELLSSEFSALPGPLQVWMVFDPLRDFMMPGRDENEAAHMGEVKAWCRALLSEFSWLTLSLVHHKRKSGGKNKTGVELSGSGALWGMADSILIWDADKPDTDDDDDDSSEQLFVSEILHGTYRVETRGESPMRGKWRMEPVSGLIVPVTGRIVTSGGATVRGTAKQGVESAIRTAGPVGVSAQDLVDQCGFDGPNALKNARTTAHRVVSGGKATYLDSRWYWRGLSPRDVGGMLDDPPDDDLPEDPVHSI